MKQVKINLTDELDLMSTENRFVFFPKKLPVLDGKEIV